MFLETSKQLPGYAPQSLQLLDGQPKIGVPD